MGDREEETGKSEEEMENGKWGRGKMARHFGFQNTYPFPSLLRRQESTRFCVCGSLFEGLNSWIPASAGMTK